MPERLQKRGGRSRMAFGPDRLRYEVGEDLGRDVERVGAGSPPLGKTFGTTEESKGKTPGTPKRDRDSGKC